MPTTRPKFRQAESRAKMRALNAWIPETLHRALMLERLNHGMSVNQIVREALAEWVRRRKHTRKEAG